MVVRRADRRDVDLLMALHQADNPAGLYSEDAIIEEIEDANGSLIVDDVEGTCCWLVAHPRAQVVRVVLLLPRGKSLALLRFPFKASMRAIMARYPQVSTWAIEARFPSKVRPRERRDVFPVGPRAGMVDEGQQIALTWQQVFTGAVVASEVEPDNTYWKISLPTAAQARTVVETWP